ncbi:MAG: AAA family ATPase [Leadbetterella sp.]|nr:AAA family ATPase [Leadbetterella sp.]
MNKIGFKNFRRFQDFNPLDYSGITFLVGRNNAGKSTLVKALLLIDNYFKVDPIESLSFGNNVLEDANIVTYGRAKNHQAQENYIKFTQEIENYLIELTVTGENDKAFANVHLLSITDISRKLNFIFNIQNGFIRVVKYREKQINNFNLEEKFILEELYDLNNQINKTNIQLADPSLKKTSNEYIELLVMREKLLFKSQNLENLKYLNHFKSVNSVVEKDEVLFSLDEDFGDLKSFSEIVDGFLRQSMLQYEREFQNVQNGEQASERFEDLRALKELEPAFIESSFSHFMTLMRNISIAYMGANPAKQSALFAIRDKNNALAQAIHEYKQLNILEGEEENRFVLKWMQVFEVGDDFSISMHAGEAYEMRILSNNVRIHLADKGMGSIQAMLLIMRIACVIKRIKLAEKNSTVNHVVDGKELKQDSSNYGRINKTTVIIEEPELNLHPALQSKLADLFLDVHQRFNIDFLIETHSEYILRRSQVIVAENEFEVAPNENPFCVHYFPKDYDQLPYRLDYQEDGSFNRNFGDGFFDEASSSTLELLKLKRQKKA